VAEYNVAWLRDVIVKLQCPSCFAEQRRELTLAVLQGRLAQIPTAKLEEIEGEQHGLGLGLLREGCSMSRPIMSTWPNADGGVRAQEPPTAGVN
jgi:hypothetical protein